MTCGDAQVAAIRPGQFIRLELPPGQYWLRAGTKKFAWHFTPTDYLALSVEGGKSYYLRTQIVASGWINPGWPQFIQIENTVGANELRMMDSSAERKLDKSWIAENVSILQALPKQQESQQPEQRSPSTPQESEQLGPDTLFGH